MHRQGTAMTQSETKVFRLTPLELELLDSVKGGSNRRQKLNVCILKSAAAASFTAPILHAMESQFQRLETRLDDLSIDRANAPKTEPDKPKGDGTNTAGASTVLQCLVKVLTEFKPAKTRPAAVERTAKALQQITLGGLANHEALALGLAELLELIPPELAADFRSSGVLSQQASILKNLKGK